LVDHGEIIVAATYRKEEEGDVLEAEVLLIELSIGGLGGSGAKCYA
jgi:hypothetical protein